MSAIDLARDLAARLELRKRPRSWGGNCPSCGYVNAFAMKLNPKYSRPIFFCANGCSREELSRAAERALGVVWTPPPAFDPKKLDEARAAKARAAETLWNHSAAIADGDPAGRYLARRGLPHLQPSAALRYRADCWHPEGTRRPAVIAAVQDAQGRLLGVHRTYLGTDGRKAIVDPVKASLGPIWGGAIQLDPVAAEMVIAEGIETAASAGMLMNLPAWAAVSAGNMAQGLALPVDLTSVVIAADPDEPGRRAAQAAAARWGAEGRRVRIATPG